jgi:uncharacterized protein Usg
MQRNSAKNRVIHIACLCFCSIFYEMVSDHLSIDVQKVWQKYNVVAKVQQMKGRCTKIQEQTQNKHMTLYIYKRKIPYPLEIITYSKKVQSICIFICQ